jgi:uncharacterized protein (UPF0303 family)
MDIEELAAQEQRLVFSQFTAETALALGQRLMALARDRELPIVINIRTPVWTMFHAAMPGAKPLNDQWARRKSNTTLMFHESSLLVGSRLRAKPDTLERQALAHADYSDSGGSFPIRVKGAGVVAAVTVSGLPQVDDHALVVEALDAMIG